MPPSRQVRPNASRPPFRDRKSSPPAAPCCARAREPREQPCPRGASSRSPETTSAQQPQRTFHTHKPAVRLLLTTQPFNGGNNFGRDHINRPVSVHFSESS